MKVAAVDQGTTSTKSFTYNDEGQFIQIHSLEHRQHYPRAGWVEHDPLELLAHVKETIEATGLVDAIGIANQGETVIAFDGLTGRPIYNAIVWQDDRTKEYTAKLKNSGAEERTLKVAGLPLDPYFSASKLGWLLNNAPEARELLQQKRLRLGTSDAFLHYHLTGRFVTDVTTASRTSLMSLEDFQWSDELTTLFGVPRECLPEILPTAGHFGDHKGIPVTASLVDQQAALFGHGCEKRGDAKITFGTGAFALALVGPQRMDGSRFGILPTVAWKFRHAHEFALEGGVYNAASAVNWAKGLGLFSSYDELDQFTAPPAILRNLAFVPALSGLACPHWDRAAAGTWIGLGLDTTRSDLVQSLIEGIAFRAAEVIAAMSSLLPLNRSVSADGGLTNSNYLLQILADITEREVVVPASKELTAYGTARMAIRGLERSPPPPPQPKLVVSPRNALGPEARKQFAEAVRRAKGWKIASPSTRKSGC